MCRHQIILFLALTVALGAVPARLCQAQWRVDGAPVCTAANVQESATIIADGAGGAIVTWQDFRTGTSFDIYAQRVDAAGVPQWTLDGVPLCIHAEDQEYPTITSDGAGGAIVTWVDERSGNGDIYAQRV